MLRVSSLAVLKVAAIIFIFIFSSCSLEAENKDEVVRIVIDPGHGGKNIKPISKYGDKYDPVTKKYLIQYREGATYKKYVEREIMLKLALATEKILKLTENKKSFEKFKKILQKYSSQKIFPYIKFDILLTHKKNYHQIFKNENEDINAPFRHYDFLDYKTGEKRKGRLSKINDFQPELVLSLHLTPGDKKGGMAAVITPPYRVFNLARLFVYNPSLKKIYKDKFDKSPWKHWMHFTDDRSLFQNFICDAWVYFTGYWSDKTGLKANLKKWRGYRWNMLTWRYNDDKGWLKKVAKKEGTFNPDLKKFQPNNKFFEREKSKPELWRRSKGEEGFGGDNNYAAQELMRFVQYAKNRYYKNLSKKEKKKRKKEMPGPILDPYFSTWEIPTYINAVSAFLEIGVINSKNDMKFLTKHRHISAEALAVGIYSLYRGLKLKKSKGKVMPKGKKLDFKKYRDYKDNYFKMASE